MEYKDAIEKVKTLDGADEVVEALNSRLTKVNNEAKTLRKDRDTLKTKVDGFDTLNTTLTDSGLDLAGDIKEQISEFKTNAEKGTKAEDENTELTKTLGKLQKGFDTLNLEFEKEKKEKTDLALTNRNSKISDALVKELNPKIYAAKETVRGLILDKRVDLAEDGKTIEFINGDERLNFKDGIEGVLEEFKDNRKSEQVPGAGSSTGGPSKEKGPGLTDEEKETVGSIN